MILTAGVDLLFAWEQKNRGQKRRIGGRNELVFPAALTMNHILGALSGAEIEPIRAHLAPVTLHKRDALSLKTTIRLKL